MSQFQRILQLIKANNGEIDCGTLAKFGAYHKASSRLGDEAERKGYKFEFIRGDTWDQARYRLVSEPMGEIKWEEGQSSWL